VAIYRRCNSRPVGLVVGLAGPTWGLLDLILHQMLLWFMLKQNSTTIGALSVEIRPEWCLVLGGG
jgi:hypothetical protein